MKSSILRISISILIFLSFILAIVFVMRPVYVVVNNAFDSVQKKAMHVLEEKTHMKFSYSSLSPSILSKIYLKGISVYDAENGDEIFTIKKAVVHYSLSRILKKDYDNAFTKVVVNDMNLDLTQEKIDFIKSNFSKNKKSDRKTLEEISEMVNRIAFYLPFEVQLKNVNASYTTSRGDFYSFSLRIVNIRKAQDASLYFRVFGSHYGKLARLHGYSEGVNFYVDGNLIKMLHGSSFRVRLDNLARADYSVNRLEFLVNYRNDILSVRSTQRLHSYKLYASFDLKNRELFTSLESKNFNPYELFKVPYWSGVLKFFHGSVLTTQSSFSAKFSEGKYSWNSESEVRLPFRFSKKGQWVSFNAKGDLKNIVVSSMKAWGERCEGTFSGSFNIPALRPSGSLSIDYFLYPRNDKVLSGDFFIEPMNRGFMVVSPGVNLEGHTLTAFQTYANISRRSIDFSVETLDYTHSEFDVPGKIEATGSITLGAKKYLQVNASLSNEFVDSALYVTSFFADSEKKQTFGKLSKKFKPYITTFEVFISSDFKNYTYNSPSVLIANTQADKQVLFLSFDGNNASVSVSQIDLIYGSNSFYGSGEYDYSSKDKQMTFALDFSFNSIPYEITGNYVIGDNLYVNGSYGLELYAKFDPDKITGSASIENFPLTLSKYTFSLSCSSDYVYSSLDDFNVYINKFDFYEITGNFRTKPHFNMTGVVDQKSFVSSELLYQDNFSRNSGNAIVFWNVNDSILESASLELNMVSDNEKENIHMKAEVNNPLKLALNGENFRKDFYFQAQVNVDNYPVNRILVGQNANNSLSFDINATGTVENPYLSVDLRNAAVGIGGSILHASATASFIENILTVEHLDARWNKFSISNCTSKINFEEFSGSAGFDAHLAFGTKFADSRIILNLQNLSMEQKKTSLFPEMYSVEFRCNSATGNFFENFTPKSITFIKSPGHSDIMSDSSIGLYGDYSEDGNLHLAIAQDKSIHFDINGYIRKQEMNLDIEDFHCDVKTIAPLLNSDLFSFYSGVIEGNLTLKGFVTDPDLDGRLRVYDADFNLPSFIPDHFVSSEVPIEFSQEEISIPETLFTIKTGVASVGANIYLDRWSLSSIQLSLQTLANRDLPVNAKFGNFEVKGKTSIDANLIIENGVTTLKGSVGLKNSDIIMNFNTGSKKDESEEKDSEKNSYMDYVIDLDVFVDKRVHVIINPLMRALIAPSTPISVNVDTSSGQWNINGDIVLRGGEISYLSRNFYLKEGRLILNESQNKFDPIITVRAETRERDSDGENVTIVLSAIKQRVSTFNATLSSIPVKSEAEIMELLGQILKGDSKSVGNFLAAGVDYGVQVTLLRKVENGLRDLCNFDIFSVRTTILQNSIMQGFDRGKDNRNSSVVGNLFDNTTVYMGKYFGSDIYADALMYWTYDKNRAGSDGNAGSGLVFHPVIGLELTAPFADIRWSFAPDLSELQQSWAQSTSVTLSWRLSF